MKRSSGERRPRTGTLHDAVLAAVLLLVLVMVAYTISGGFVEGDGGDVVSVDAAPEVAGRGRELPERLALDASSLARDPSASAKAPTPPERDELVFEIVCFENGVTRPAAFAEVEVVRFSERENASPWTAFGAQEERPRAVDAEIARADARGIARFPAPFGGVRVRATAGAWTGCDRVIGRSPEPVRLVLVPAERLDVMVLRSDGRPASGVDIALSVTDETFSETWDTASIRARSDDGGRATFTHAHAMLASARRLDARCHIGVVDCPESRVELDYDAVPKTPVILRLPPAGSLEVTLRGHAGEDDGRAYVVTLEPDVHAGSQGFGASSIRTRIDETATFDLVQGAATFTLSARAEGVWAPRSSCAQSQLTMPGAPGFRECVDIDVQQPGARRYQGRLVGPTSGALARQKVAAQLLGADGEQEVRHDGTLRTDGAGAFEIQLGAAGSATPWTLRLRHEIAGSPTVLEACIELPVILPDGLVDLGDVLMRSEWREADLPFETGEIRGSLLLPPGVDPTLLGVILRGGRESAVPSPDGSFRIGGIAPRVVDVGIVVAATDLLIHSIPDVDVASREVNRHQRLQAIDLRDLLVTIDVRVLDQRGAPLEDATVDVSDRARADELWSADPLDLKMKRRHVRDARGVRLLARKGATLSAHARAPGRRSRSASISAPAADILLADPQNLTVVVPADFRAALGDRALGLMMDSDLPGIALPVEEEVGVDEAGAEDGTRCGVRGPATSDLVVFDSDGRARLQAGEVGTHELTLWIRRQGRWHELPTAVPIEVMIDETAESQTLKLNLPVSLLE